MPGRRTKRSAPTDLDDEETDLNFALVEWNENDIDLTPPTYKYSRSYSNVPIKICNSTTVQSASDKNFAYITERAAHLSRFNWCLSQPGHGHFIEASRDMAIQFEPSIICDTSQSCQNTMQERYSTPFIFDDLSKMATFCADTKLPSIQGYYAHCDNSVSDQQCSSDIKTHEQIIQSLKDRAGLEMIIIELA
jgi:hypothetical protein